MPISRRPDAKPVIAFEPRLEISPFTLYRRLADGAEVLLVDVRAAGDRERTLAGAERWPGPSWQPPDGRDVVLFDDDGTLAVDLTRELQGRGHDRVRALFGGLDLYAFSLDPEVVGQRTFLVGAGGA